MKQLGSAEMIELLPERDTAALREFELAAPILARDPGYLKTLADEGWVNLITVSQEGQRSHLFGWHMTPDKGFWLDIVLALEKPMPHANFIRTAESYARSQGARYIRWVTLRRGIVHWAQEAGYTPEAIILTKVL